MTWTPTSVGETSKTSFPREHFSSVGGMPSPEDFCLIRGAYLAMAGIQPLLLLSFPPLRHSREGGNPFFISPSILSLMRVAFLGACANPSCLRVLPLQGVAQKAILAKVSVFCALEGL